jgi:hypothetical protein
MMTMLDVRTPPAVFAFSKPELEIIETALGIRKADLIGMRTFCERVGNVNEQLRYGREILELDILRTKLGFIGKDEE